MRKVKEFKKRERRKETRRTNLNKTSAAGKSKFQMEKSFQPFFMNMQSHFICWANEDSGPIHPQRVQPGVLYSHSLHLNANDHTIA